MILDTTIPGVRAGDPPRSYRVTRIIPLICAKPADGTTTGGTLQ
jgi:hypothetical protein